MKGLISGCFALLLCMAFCVGAKAANAYIVNGVTVHYNDFTSSPSECWAYANNVYNKIWGQRFDSTFDDDDNILKDLKDSELTLTSGHLKEYVSQAALGSVLRICNAGYLHANDGWGHSQIIVQKDSEGFTVLQGGLSASPYCNEDYYTWEEYCSTRWLGGKYSYIKYIKCPGGSPDPSAVTDTHSGHNSKPVITGANAPGTVTVGSAFSLSGLISCEEPLTKVTVGCFDTDGKMKVGKTVHPHTKRYDIKKVDAAVRFGQLKPGIYRYQVRAAASSGTTVLVDQAFVVLSKSATVKNGSYVLHPRADKSYAVGIKSNSGKSGANAELVKAKDHPSQAFYVHHEGKGYYTLQNAGSGLYLEADTGKGQGMNVRQGKKSSSSAQRWQILPVGDSWCLVPKCSKKLCLDFGKSAAAGANLAASTASMDLTQKFQMKKSSYYPKGTKLTDSASGIVYKVTKPGASVSFAGIKKNTGTVKIPETVKLKGRTYKVTSIAANALKGNHKLKKVVISKNVTSIGKKAFYDCRNLTAVTIKTKNLSSKGIGSNAFTKAGSKNYRKLQVKVPSKMLKTYKKIFRQKGLSGKAKVLK